MSIRVLVTGAAGFIGSAVAARLSREGMSVTAVDNFNDYYGIQLKRDRVNALLTPVSVECRVVELADEKQVRQLFEDSRPELVVHLAAQAGVRYSLTNPKAYLQSNLIAFGNVVEACHKYDVRHFMYASSSSVYGERQSGVFVESDSTDAPASLYAATKKSNEVMAHAYSQLYSLPTTGVRLFTVYGPWGRPDMAYFSFTENILAGLPIRVYADGMLARDFTYIDDIVESIVRLLRKPTVGNIPVPHNIFNIGSHRPITVLGLIRVLERLTGKKAQIEFAPMQKGDVSSTCADIGKLRDWIDFAPATQLEAGLSAFHGWLVDWRKHA